MSSHRFLTPAQGWQLAARNAIARGECPPTSPSDPRLSPAEMRSWHLDCRNKAVKGDLIPTPTEWLQTQSSQQTRKNSVDLWSDVTKWRQEQAEQREHQERLQKQAWQQGQQAKADDCDG